MTCSAQSSRRKFDSRYRGIFILDALLGLVLIVAIAGALGAVTSEQQRAAIRAAEMRDALRRAEAGLTLLQAHQPASTEVAIKRLAGAAPPGWMWVEASGRAGERTAVVTGLVPAGGGNQ